MCGFIAQFVEHSTGTAEVTALQAATILAAMASGKSICD